MMPRNDANLLGVYAKMRRHELKHAAIGKVLLSGVFDRYQKGILRDLLE